MKSVEFLDIVKNMEQAVFTTNDAVKITGKDAKYVRLYLYRLKKGGYIQELERGKFALFDHPFAVASGIIFPSYISFFSALSYYDLTTQMPRIIYTAALKSKKTMRLKDYELKFIKMKKERFFGYNKEKYRGKVVFIASLEKTIIDSLLLPAYCPLDETFNALKNTITDKRVEPEKLLNYALKMKTSVVLKRIGFMLELLGYNYHEKLEKKLTEKFDKLDPLGKQTQKKNNKWKLYINEELA